MSTRFEITRKFAKAYVRADKGGKGVILDQVMEVTGWSRVNARRRLTQAASGSGSHRSLSAVPRSAPRSVKYSLESRTILERVWVFSGGGCGKYLEVSMGVLLDNLECHGELVMGQNLYSDRVREELLSMSSATIDRYLHAVKARDQLRGKSTTKPGDLLRNSITIRRAGDEVEQVPGFFEVDTVAHCGPTLVGEFARTVNFTDMYTGWVYTRSMRNNAHAHMLTALNRAMMMIPFPVTGLDCDNGSEFMNKSVLAWVGDKNIYFTRSRPYKKNDQATIESKNYHVVRKYGWYYRYDTPEELTILNRMWVLVNDRLNFFTPTKKPIGYATDQIGRRKRVYDTPKTPVDRLIESGILTDDQIEKLEAKKAQLNIADITRKISVFQHKLLTLAADKTRILEEKNTPKTPNPTTGIKVKITN